MAAEGIIHLVDGFTTTGDSAPKLIDARNASAGGSERICSRSPAILDILRPGTVTGTVKVMGADITNPGSDANSELREGDGATDVFDTEIAYVAPHATDLNWLVIGGYGTRSPIVFAGDTAAASGTKVGITNNGGNARVTFHADDTPGDSGGNNTAKRFAVFFVTAEEILADGAHERERTTIVTRDIMWVVGAGTVTSTDIYIEPAPAGC